MATKATRAPARGRRTKAEVQQEFEQIREQAETEREAADAKAEEAARLREGEVRQAVGGVTVDGVVQKIPASAWRSRACWPASPSNSPGK